MDFVLGEDIMEWVTDQGDIDTILAVALEQYETTAKYADVDVDGTGYSNCSSMPPLCPQTSSTSSLDDGAWSSSSLFAGPKTDLEIKQAIEQGIPLKILATERCGRRRHRLLEL